MKTKMREIFEKLLPKRFWKGRQPMEQEQYYAALGQNVNHQTQALLDLLQERFNTHIQTACDTVSDDKTRLRALDRALAISEALDSWDRDMTKAKEILETEIKQEQERGKTSQ